MSRKLANPTSSPLLRPTGTGKSSDAEEGKFPNIQVYHDQKSRKYYLEMGIHGFSLTRKEARILSSQLLLADL